MDKIKVFRNYDFEVRVTMKDDEFWFVGKDVAEALGYSDTFGALKKHVDNEDKTTMPIQQSGSNYKTMATIINESGLYSLILSSKLPTAKRFKRWVMDELIPMLHSKNPVTTISNEVYKENTLDLVQVVNNQIVTSSLDVAEKFNKNHKHVLEAIEKYIRAENSALTSWFFKTTYTSGTGRNYPMYLMNRDGFSLLVMGFTGKEALEWKIKYINAFSEMEKQLKIKQTLPDFTNPVKAAKAWIQQYEEKQQLQKQLDEAKPKVEFADVITACKTSIPVGLFAKIIAKELDIGRNRLFEKLREWNLLMTLPSEYNKPTQKAIEMKIFEIAEKGNKDVLKSKVKVTPKGQLYIYKRLKGYADEIQQTEQIEAPRKPLKMVKPLSVPVLKEVLKC